LTPDGYALINRDNSEFDFLEKAATGLGVAHVLSFGADPKADFRLADYLQDGERAFFWAVIGGRSVEVAINAPGRHIAENAVAVLAASYLAGADMLRVVPAFASVSAAKGRGERIRLVLPDGEFTLIDESYNANPASMRAAIELLASAETHGRHIAVLGDMLEMGEFSADVHRELAEPLGKSGINDIWLAGPDMACLRDVLGGDREVVYRANADELAAYAVENVRPGDVLMVKSSKGTGFGRIVAALTAKFAAAASPE
jgi:UDP-N-acetylmuramoyl-tripeptide--D-alanyl-D-alanine ligase